MIKKVQIPHKPQQVKCIAEKAPSDGWEWNSGCAGIRNMLLQWSQNVDSMMQLSEILCKPESYTEFMY